MIITIYDNPSIIIYDNPSMIIYDNPSMIIYDNPSQDMSNAFAQSILSCILDEDL